MPSAAGTTSITQTVEAAIRPGRVEVAAQVDRIDPQEGQRQHDDDGFAEIRLDQAAASGGTARPTKIEAATTSVPWRPARASAAAGSGEHNSLRENSGRRWVQP